MHTRGSLANIFSHNVECHNDSLNEVNLNSLVVLELPQVSSNNQETENSDLTKLILTAGILNTATTSAQRTAVKLWCCGYCMEEPPNRSRDGILKHIGRAHRSIMRVRCSKCDYVSSDEFKLAIHHTKNHEGTAEIDYYSLVDTTSFFSNTESNYDVVVAVQIRRDCKYLVTRASVDEKSLTSDQLSFYAQCGVKPEGIEQHKRALARIESLSLDQKKDYSRCTPLSIENPLFSNMWYRKAQEEGGNRYLYCCNNCPYKTTLTADVTRHILSVHIFIYPFRCPLCPNRGVRASNVARHLLENHPGSHSQTMYWSVFTCPYYEFLLENIPETLKSIKCESMSYPDLNCSQETEVESVSPIHDINNSTDTPKHVLSCIECNGYKVNINDCQVVYRMKHHVFRHLNVKPFCCTQCNAPFSGRSNTIRHLQSVHKISKNYANSYILQVLSEDDTTRALSIVCKCAANVNYKVIRHRSGYKCVPNESNEQEFIPEGYEDEIISYRNKQQPEHKIHITRQCPLCDQIMESPTDVGEHLVKVHKQSEIVQCHLCTYTNENWEEMVAHVMNHLGYLGYQEVNKDMEVMTVLKKLLKYTPSHNNTISTTFASFSSLMDGLGPLKVQRQGDKECTFLSPTTTQLKAPLNSTPSIVDAQKKIKFMCTQCTYSTHKWHNLKMHLGVHFDYSLRFQCSICMSRFRDAYSTNNHAAEKHPRQIYEVLRIYLPDVEKMVEDELIECVRLGGNFNAINVSKMKFSCDTQKRKFEVAVEQMRNDAFNSL